MTIDELVDSLLDRHMLIEVADAVRDDENVGELAQVCAGLSGGDAGTLSAVFEEVSTLLDVAGRLDAVVEADSPASALADLVRRQHDSLRSIT